MLKETLSQNLHTQLQTVNNSIITLSDTDDTGKGRHFKSRFIQPGIAGYPKDTFGNVLVRKETLDNSLNTIIGAPVIINHKEITDKNADDERVGVISDAYYNDKDGWYWCEGVIWNETAQNLITDKKWSVSCSYDYLEEDDGGGSENNIPYDREFTKLNFKHLALVNNPRYERANIVFNSKVETVDNTIDTATKEKEQQNMAVLDKLKELISSIENGKDEETKEKKQEPVENEETDKRKLIDEVGGILKGKVDDEIIRTVIGKLEKIAYEKSEARTADNKVKNTEEPAKDEKKADEPKKDVKEELENKKPCNNSIDNAVDYYEKMNKIYNASLEAPQENKDYISQEERLEAGKKY